MWINDGGADGPRRPRGATTSSAANDADANAEAQAKQLETARKAVEDAATVSGTLWLSYVFVLLYLAVAAGSVTHVDLLLERSVKLPFLNIDLPLVPFFALAPWLFIVTHVYALVHFVMLSAKVGRLNDELAEDKRRGEVDKEKIRQALPSSVFVQFLAGPRAARFGLFGRILRSIAWITLVFAPVLLLLLLQAQFLPYQFSPVTSLQRVAVVADIVLLWTLWPAVISRDGTLRWPWQHLGDWWSGFAGAGFGRRFVTRPWLVLCIALGTTTPVILALMAATFPGERYAKSLRMRDWLPTNRIRKLLFEGEVDKVSRRPSSLFSNRIVVSGVNFLDALKIDDTNKLDWAKVTVSLRGRRLQRAVFDGAVLSKADLEGADLRGASLKSSELAKASLEGGQLQGARLDNARLQGARFGCAQPQDALPKCAQLQDATLVGAQLQGAQFDCALPQNWLSKCPQLQGARLDRAQLQGVSLAGANLQGASLTYAELQGANLFKASLQGANLFNASLQGATLAYASLQGATLAYASLQGASLDSASLQGASLVGASLQGASLVRASLQGASLVRASLQGASLVSASLQGASLDLASLQGARLDLASLQVASLDIAAVWRSSSNKALFDRIRSRDVTWTAIFEHPFGRSPWTHTDFLALQASIGRDVPPGPRRKGALQRIANLDPDGDDWFDYAESGLTAVRILSSTVGLEDYRKALAAALRSLLCKGGADAVFVARGLANNGRIGDLAGSAPAWVEDILKSCPIAGLTDDDRAILRKAATQAAKLAKRAAERAKRAPVP